MNTYFLNLRLNQLILHKKQLREKRSALQYKFDEAQEYYENEWGDPWKCGAIMGKVYPQIKYLDERIAAVNTEIRLVREKLRRHTFKPR